MSRSLFIQYFCDSSPTMSECETIALEKSLLKKTGKRKRTSTNLTVGKFKCSICAMCLTTPSSRNKHMLIHSDHKEFSCEICSKAFRRKDQLKKHLLTHFRGHGLSKLDLTSTPLDALCLQFEPKIPKNYKCDICSKVCTSSSHLRSHMTSHSNLKPFCCGICSKAFKRRDNLRSHFAVFHPKCHHNYMEYAFVEELNVGDVMKKFQCDICSKGFNHKESVRIHLFAHAGLDPFKCEICSEGFRSRTQFRGHLKSSHDETKKNN